MEEEEKEPMKLPENAFRELNEGEEFHPVMSPEKTYREVTPWSVSWGIVMAVIFSAAAAYLGLKVGQVFEAAIPIAIIAVGLSNSTKRKNGSNRSWRYFYLTGIIYHPRIDGKFYASLFEFPFGRYFRNTIFNPIP